MDITYLNNLMAIYDFNMTDSDPGLHYLWDNLFCWRAQQTRPRPPED